jgi:hypothetical protein
MNWSEYHWTFTCWQLAISEGIAKNLTSHEIEQLANKYAAKFVPAVTKRLITEVGKWFNWTEVRQSISEAHK